MIRSTFSLLHRSFKKAVARKKIYRATLRDARSACARKSNDQSLSVHVCMFKLFLLHELDTGSLKPRLRPARSLVRLVSLELAKTMTGVCHYPIIFERNAQQFQYPLTNLSAFLPTGLTSFNFSLSQPIYMIDFDWLNKISGK